MVIKATGMATPEAPTVEVLYVCDAKHVTDIRFHAQVKDFPKTWNCVTCHKKAKYVASANTPTEEYVPDPKKLTADMLDPDDPAEDDDNYLTIGGDGRYTVGHLRALYERRTREELEALLEERLTMLRNSRRVV